MYNFCHVDVSSSQTSLDSSSQVFREGYRILKNPKHGLTGDRNGVACMNLFLKSLNSRCTGLHCASEYP
ncbi:hypothetical protein [Desulfurococcus amylolyticus]|uniref:hypothetical protein n=1 Tax=Desulfurococcus amylolyticus TaxID=94694 RepID=UPI001F2A7462|nr:hypothetical protein [Desulfurococcus amylolyticus]